MTLVEKTDLRTISLLQRANLLARREDLRTLAPPESYRKTDIVHIIETLPGFNLS